MRRVEIDANKYVASALISAYPWVTNAIAPSEEDYTVGDVLFSAMTDCGVIGYQLENKSILGGYQLKYNGQWNTYFTSDIYDKLHFESLPPAEGTPIYFINDSKWNRLLDAHACLCFLAPDGMLLFSHKELKEAFLCFADYYVSKTTQFGNKKRGWERKAVLSLEKGTYIPLNPPAYLFDKNKKTIHN